MSVIIGVVQITKFPERIRIRIKIDDDLYIKPDKSDDDEKYQGIIYEYGKIYRTKILDGVVINVKLTSEGEHIINNIAEKFMLIGDMLNIDVDNDTGEVVFNNNMISKVENLTL